MDEQPPSDADPPDAPGPAPDGGPGTPEPEAPEARALAAEAQEIRRLIDAGAGSPEELRQLAERLRVHREREDAMWRAEVKPALVKSRKGTFSLGHLRSDKPAPPTPAQPHRSSLVAGLGLLGMVVVVVLLASASSILWLVVPVAAVLAYAWWHGTQGSSS
jgi:hypothetical protein